jgi:hypothetical protein
LSLGLAHDAAAGEGSDGVEPAVEEERGQHCLHGIGKDGAFAAEAAALLAAAEAQVAPEIDGGGHLGHVLAADQLGAHAGQLALLPLGVGLEESLGDDQAKDGVAEELEALVVFSGRGFGVAVSSGQPACGSFIGQRAVGERAEQELAAGKGMSQCGFQFDQFSFHARLVRFDSTKSCRMDRFWVTA